MPQKHTFRASKGDGGFNHERRPGRKGVTGFIATKQCTRYSTNAPDSTPLHWQLSSAMPPQAVQCPRGTNAIAERTPRPIIPHAIPTQPDPTPTRNPQNSNDLNSIFERVTGELHAKLLSGGGAWPGFETTRQATQYTTSAAGVEGAGGSCRGARGRWRGLAGLRVDAPSEARGADGSRAGRRPPAHTAAGPSGAPNTSGATSNATEQATLSRNYSPARRSTSCMMRPHTALTHATAATPRTRERQGLTCRKSSKP